MTDGSRIHQNRGPVVIIAALIMMGAAFWGLNTALHELHANWTGAFGHYSHGYLVLGMSVWLAWRAWRANPVSPGPVAWPALLLLAALVAMMFASVVTSVDTVSQSLLPPIALVSMAATFGWAMALRFFWPLAFMYTALPVSWYINDFLQELTSLVVNSMVKLTHVPAFVEGNVFHLPAGTLEIAAGCSGLRFMNTAVALSLFQGLLYLQSWRDRLKLLAVAIALALLANWLRVYSLMVIAYATDMRHYLVRVEHLYYGWAVFLVCLWPMFWYGAKLERKTPAIESHAPRLVMNPRFRPALSLAAAVLVAALLLAPRLVQAELERRSQHIASLAPLSSASPEVRAAWIFGEGTLIAGAEEERASFRADDSPIWLYRATALQPSQLAGWPRDGMILFDKRWTPAQDGLSTAGTAGSLSFQQRHGELSGTEVVVRSASMTAGATVDSLMDQKLAMLRGLLKQRQDALIWIVATTCKPDCSTGVARLDAWLRENSGLLNSR